MTLALAALCASFVALALSAAPALAASQILEVESGGGGKGTITSSPGGIDYISFAVCEAPFAEGTVVTLTANPEPGSEFTGWSGCVPTSATECEVTMSGFERVSGTFAPVPQFNLEVSVSGKGSVKANSGSISGCTESSGVCSDEYEEGTEVTLTETPAAHQKFAAWSGCAPTSPTECKVTLSEDTVVTAGFEPIEFNLEVSVSGKGSVKANSGSISGCTESSGVCSDEYEEGTEVTLTETPAAHQKFAAWSGCAPTSPTECKVTLSEDTVVTAGFEPSVPQTLEVTLAGKGEGTITSSPAGIECSSATCEAEFEEGTVVTLTASPEPGSAFTGWSGCVSTSPTECKVTMDGYRPVTATFQPVHTLEVSVSGGGSVSANSGPISGCTASAGTCSGSYNQGTEVTLTATPNPNQEFSGWSGGGCSGTGTCKVTVNAETSVSANFTPILHTLEVSVSGGGSVSANSGPISGCTASAGTCSGSYNQGTEVTLTATPNPNQEFSGWSGGGCSGTGTCKVTVNAETSVSANFTPILHTLEVSVSGGGSVSANSGPISGCTASAGTCSGSYNQGTEVTLTATPNPNQEFSGWSGGGCSGTGTCKVTVNAETSVSANFTPILHTLEVSVSGGGSVSANSGPISGCTASAGTCSGSYNQGTEVTLTATPNPNQEFSGWSGGGCSGTGTCKVTVNAETSVSANFTPILHTLEVSVSGGGSVSANSGPISGCTASAGTCSGSYNQGTEVTLTATPNPNQEFSGWSGGGCSGTGTCKVTVNAETSVSANFTPILHTLEVSVSGGGSVSANSGPISGCTASAGTCSGSYNQGTEVTLTATPNPNQEFSGWSAGAARAPAPAK